VFPDEGRWNSWWPKSENKGYVQSEAPGFPFKGNIYRVIDKRLTSILISISTGKDSLLSELLFIPSNDPFMSLNWIAEMEAPSNPFERVKAFFGTKALAKDMKIILQSLEKHYASEKNIYGLDIKKEFVQDSLLVSSFFIAEEYPGAAEIYRLVDRLKTYVARNGARQTGAPMLNITTSDSSTYYTKVALPVDRKLKDSGDIQYRWMLGRGDILIAEVAGGTNSINNAFREMEHYVTDYRRQAPAIPFQSLVTDRRLVSDTSKWITKICWPVM
jgi:hypothetical protein